jgi:hypothetical protein
MTTYNKAKENMAKSLNLQPNTLQYGYNANPYAQLMSSLNPYYDEHKD